MAGLPHRAPLLVLFLLVLGSATGCARIQPLAADPSVDPLPSLDAAQAQGIDRDASVATALAATHSATPPEVVSVERMLSNNILNVNGRYGPEPIWLVRLAGTFKRHCDGEPGCEPFSMLEEIVVDALTGKIVFSANQMPRPSQFPSEGWLLPVATPMP